MLYCPTDRSPTGLAKKAPAHGGYRRLHDHAERERLRTEMAATTFPLIDKADRASPAFHAALWDLQDELKACMSAADPIVPNLSYVLSIGFSGNARATIVAQLTLTRVDVGTHSELPTTAEPCVDNVLRLLELPPSTQEGGFMMILRYDFCTTAYDRDRTIAQEHMRAYPRWLAKHPGGCPARLEELHPYMTLADTTDSWGHPFQHRCRGGVLEVWSAGHDGIENNDDDVTSWR
jgi:type II secretion system (T2SS) protein G